MRLTGSFQTMTFQGVSVARMFSRAVSRSVSLRVPVERVTAVVFIGFLCGRFPLIIRAGMRCPCVTPVFVLRYCGIRPALLPHRVLVICHTTALRVKNTLCSD